MRFAFVVVGFLLENLWLVLRWAVVTRPRRGGRDRSEEFTFSVFCDWIRHTLEQELERRWKIEMKGGRRAGCVHHGRGLASARGLGVPFVSTSYRLGSSEASMLGALSTQ